MKDFILASGAWSFYGLLAQAPGDAARFVLAIRGTSDPTEWWDDLTSAVPAPWVGAGHVGYGFNRIYQTLRLVERGAAAADAARSPLVATPSVGFAQQVAAVTHRHAAASGGGPVADQTLSPIPSRSIDVAGHSLGAALATLYVAENATRPGAPIATVNTPLLCTFASPLVGDAIFAQAVNGLGITSWRIVNELDIVPKLPPIGFVHIDHLHQYNSGRLVHWSLPCWHAMSTYLHLIDPSQPLGLGCALPQARAPAPAADQMSRPAPEARADPHAGTAVPDIVVPSSAKIVRAGDISPNEENTNNARDTIEITVRIG